MRFLVAILFLPMLALAQEGEQSVNSTNSRISRFLKAYTFAEGESQVSSDRVTGFFEKLSEKKSKFRNEHMLLSRMVTKTHQLFLKEFKANATFSDLLINGRYNCLTGTALYALILEHLGFKYEIIETNYHIFLLVQSNNGRVLIEATDPTQGFVTQNQKIESRISQYRLNINLMASNNNNNNKTYYHYNVSLYNTITLEGLLGLLHYNLSVNAYNIQDLVNSIDHLEKACLLLESPRLEEFSNLLFLTVHEGPFDNILKETLSNRIRSLRNQKPGLVLAGAPSF